MKQTGWVVCKAFLQLHTPEEQAALLRFMPASDQERLKNLPAPFRDPTEGITPFEELLDLVHPSWFAPFLRKLSEIEIRLFLSALSKQQVEVLKGMLLFGNQLLPLKEVAKEYLHQVLIDLLKQGEEILPIECLPSSPLNELLLLSPAKLQEALFLWGLHDLAIEISQIIDAAKVKKIYSSLAPDEKHYLQQLAMHKEPFFLGRTPLSSHEEKSAGLREWIHKRGINRLAKALWGQDASLAWHLEHRLDVSEAHELKKLSSRIEHAKAHEILLHQMGHVISLTLKQRGAA